LLLCVVVLAACVINPEETKNLEEMTRITGPASVGVGNLYFTLPEGYSIEMRESEVQPEGELFRHEHIIRKDGEIVGGVYKLAYSDLGWRNIWDWVENLNVPEHVPEERFMMWAEGFRTDTPYSAIAAYGKGGVEQSLHHFFEDEILVYDLWFNMELLSEKEKTILLESASLIPSEESTQLEEDVAQVLIGSGIPFSLSPMPEGYFYNQDEDQNVVFTDGTNTVGGIVCYPIPEGVYDPYDKGFFWLEEVGIPDFEDPSLAYSGGITSGDNGWMAEFISDVPPETELTVNRSHHFYPIGDMVYDIWFDMLKIDRNTSSRILSSVKLSRTVQPETEKTASDEDIAFSKCAAVMNAVADGSAHIVSLQKNEGYEGPSGYKRTFAYHEGNFLYTSEVLTEGENITEAGEYYNRYALLIVDDAWFSNEGHQGETGEIVWEACDPVDPTAPWLGNRIWVKSFVAYIGTMTDAEGNTVFLWRYDKPYEDREDYEDHYFVNFTFDPEGRFVNVTVQVNLYQDNAFTVTESILSLTPETVNAEIQKEYNRITQ